MDLVPIFVTAIVFCAIYKIIEVIVRRKERMIIADKLENLSNFNSTNLPDKCEELFGANRKLHHSGEVLFCLEWEWAYL